VKQDSEPSGYMETKNFLTNWKTFFLTFMFPCIVSIFITDNQQDATMLIYLFLISSTCFGRYFRPSSGAYHCNY